MDRGNMMPLSHEEVVLMEDQTDHQANNNSGNSDTFPDHRIGLIPANEGTRYKRRINSTRSPKRLSYLEAQNHQVFSIIEGRSNPMPTNAKHTSSLNSTTLLGPNHALYMKMPSPAFEYLLQGGKRRGKRRLHWCLWSTICLICLLLVTLCITYILSQYYQSQNTEKLTFRPSIYEWAYRQFNRKPIPV